MTGFARKFNSLVAVHWQEMLAYPVVSIIWILTDTIIALIMPAVWLSASGGSSMFGMTSQEMVTYYLITLVLSQFIVCHLLWDIAFSIKEGMFAIYLSRPFPIYWNFAAQNVAWRVGKVFLFVPILLIYLMAYHGYLGSMTLYPSIEFFASVVLAHILSYNMALAIAMITLWTTEFHSVFTLYYFPENFLSGRVVPLMALPWWAAAVGNFLPFRFTVALPTDIMMGRISNADAWSGIGMQALWIGGFYVLGKLLFAKGIRQYTGFGN